MNSNKSATGFTIIELMVALLIVIVLAGLGVVGVSNFLESAKRGKEIHAGRVLMAGFHAFTADHAGRIIKAMDPNPGKVVDNTGKPVMQHAARRWPWRLAPYFDYNMHMLMVNNQQAAPEKDNMYSYLVTVFPTFGMNGTFVGGKYGTGVSPDHPRKQLKGNFCVTFITQPYNPSKLIVFATAKMHGAPFVGCFDVGPPGVGAVGQVDYKFNGKAVVAYFDGHVELNDTEQIGDMRRWSNLAAIENAPDWSF